MTTSTTDPRTSGPSALVNFRDLGGTQLPAGRVRPGVLWRSDDVAVMPVADAEQLVDQGLRDVIDLRSAEELVSVGRGPLGATDVRHHHLSLMASSDAAADLMTMVGESMDASAVVGQWYADLAVARAELLVSGLRVIAASDGATLFHCAAGKDRTGIFAAAVLTVLGADAATVGHDYARTHAAMPLILERMQRYDYPWVREHHASALSGGAAAGLLGAVPQTMGVMLEVLDRDHGGLDTVLVDAGLDRDLRDALTSRVVEPA